MLNMLIHIMHVCSSLWWVSKNRLFASPLTWLTGRVAALQIQTCRQHAIAIVHSYPAIPEKGRLLEVLARQRGEPSKEVLMQSAGMDSLQHAANWQQVVEYLQNINADNLNQHVPLLVE